MDLVKLIEQIKLLSMAKGISPNTAYIESGVGKDFSVNISKKNQTPSIKKICQLAAYFGVSVDYLLGNEAENRLPAETKSLSDVENEILEIYNTLPKDKKQAFMTVARSLKSQPKD